MEPKRTDAFTVDELDVIWYSCSILVSEKAGGGDDRVIAGKLINEFREACIEKRKQIDSDSQHG